MVNLNKETIKKIKEIDTKADAVLRDAEKKSESLILEKKHRVQESVKDAQKVRDSKKATTLESAKKDAEEKSRQSIEKGILKAREKESKVEQKTYTAADIVVELFIKKIEKIGSKGGD